MMRKHHGLRQIDVANVLNCDRKAISNYELGNREPALDRLVAFADFYECTVDYLLGRTDLQEDRDITQARYAKGYLEVAESPLTPEEEDE